MMENTRNTCGRNRKTGQMARTLLGMPRAKLVAGTQGYQNGIRDNEQRKRGAKVRKFKVNFKIAQIGEHEVPMV